MATDTIFPQAMHFGPASRRLFGVLYPAPGRAHGAVVMCPPLLHEHVRSYRFFSLVAMRLAAAGIACLRFDYFGSGDSDGVSAEFLPDRAHQDIAEAAAVLRERVGAASLALLGIRASALLAQQALQAARADALWCWQPVYDGGSYVQMLDALYRRELDSRDRFPNRRAPAPVERGDLMGFRLAPEFRDAVSVLRLRPGSKISIVDSDPPANDLLDVDFHALPPAATAWADEIDLRGPIPLCDAESAIDALQRTLPGESGWAACG